MPAVLALPELLLLAALIVAYGLIVFGQAFVDALFGILRYVLKWTGGGLVFRGAKWVLGKVGVEVGNPAQAAHQWLSDKMGAAADKVATAIAASWNFLAQIVDRTGWAIWHTALAVERLYMHLTDPVWLAKQIIRTSPFVLAFRWLRAHLDTVTNVTNVINRSVINPTSSAIGAAVRVVVRVDKVALAKLSDWTHHQVRALRASIAHAGAQALPLPGTAVADLKDILNRLRKRVARIERGALPYIASGVFVATLARFGLGWLRCDRVKQAGRGVCRLDVDGLDALLAGTTAIVGSISIRQLAGELSGAMDEATGYVTAFVREAPKR